MSYQTYGKLQKLHRSKGKSLTDLVIKMGENQVKLIVAMRDAFHTRDQLLQFINLCRPILYRQYGEVLEDDDRALLEMKTTPGSLYEELCRREIDIQETLAEIGLIQEEIDKVDEK